MSGNTWAIRKASAWEHGTADRQHPLATVCEARSSATIFAFLFSDRRCEEVVGKGERSTDYCRAVPIWLMRPIKRLCLASWSSRPEHPSTRSAGKTSFCSSRTFDDHSLQDTTRQGACHCIRLLAWLCCESACCRLSLA
jgi:hypothetical protein